MTTERDEPSAWGEDRGVHRALRTPVELLAVLDAKMDRVDRDLQLLRAEIERSRLDLRQELRDRLRETDERQSERLKGIEKRLDEAEARMVDKGRYALVEVVLFGLVGLIVTAVLYSVIHGVLVSPVAPGLGVHS